MGGCGLTQTDRQETEADNRETDTDIQETEADNRETDTDIQEIEAENRETDTEAEAQNRETDTDRHETEGKNQFLGFKIRKASSRQTKQRETEKETSGDGIRCLFAQRPPFFYRNFTSQIANSPRAVPL